MAAKRAAPKTGVTIVETSIDDLISKVKDVKTGAYSNHMRASLTNSELLLDFFNAAPSVNGDFQVEHVQRIIIPLSLGKGIATAIANVIAAFESDHETKLPNTRSAAPEDIITIWP